MYKIVLIDDEEIIREGMRELINWEKLGLELVGTAVDGESGYQLITTYEPHIILLDINMPKCNGLQLTERVKQVYPDMKIILISGYDEFDYARQALRMGVEDYILKPVTRVEMEDILEKIVMQLEKEKEQNKQAIEIQNRMEESIPLIQQKILQQLINQEIDPSLIQRKCIKGNIPYNSPWYGFFVLDPDEQIGVAQYREEPLTQFAIQNIVTELLEVDSKGIAFEVDGLIAVLYTGKDDEKENREDIYHREIMRIQVAINELVDIKITIAVGGIIEEIKDIHKCYEEAKNILSGRFFRGVGKVMYGYEAIKYKHVGIVDWIKWEQYILADVLDRKKFYDGIKTIGIKMMEEKIILEDMQMIWHHMACGLIKKFIEINQKVAYQVLGDRDVNEEIKNIKTIEQIQEWVSILYDSYYRLMQNQVSTQRAYVESIKKMIDQHYTETSFSAKDVCEQIHISSSYLSQLFKKEMGQTFIQYLTEYRLEKAKKLLRHTRLKTYEVTEQVGYTDSHYFSVIFKKYTGKTPSEYRKY